MMHVELQATCSALGYQEGDTYVREPDCLETVKDLIRFLKREDDTCDIRRQLGHAQIVQNDLIPIVKQSLSEATLWETTIRLLVNLTQPAVLCFNGAAPEEKTLRNNYIEIETDLQAYKEAFVNEELYGILTEKLGELLKLDWEHRQEEDRLLIERLLILIRNILHIPPDPNDEQRTDDDATVHDQILWSMHVSGLEDILLYIGSSDEERQLSMHILEIVSLMFREQTPEVLASAGGQRSVTEKEKDERELEMVREQERLEKKANFLKHSTRHSRFGGTFVVKNMKSISDRDLIYHKSQSDTSMISLDANKKPRKKSKNLQPILDKESTRRSTLSIRLSLKEFCVQFLENCYNPLMYAVKDILNRERTQEHDETYYLWAMRFFMEFCRHHSKQVDLVSETMSVPILHYIQVQLFQYYEMQMMEKKEAIVWGKRIHLALKAYQELLLTLDSMDCSGNKQLMESSRVIKSNVFYIMEFRDIFLTLLRRFEQKRQSRTYLKDLIETTHLFLKLLEHFSKGTGHLIVQSKKKKAARRKKQKKQGPETNPELTQQELDDLWDEVSGELSAIFQGRMDIPDDVVPFDAASEVDIDQQRVDAMIKIQDSLRGRKAGEGVAIFRAAREVWPERNEFGTPDISPEDEFMALREIFMSNLPRPTSQEVPGFTEEQEEENEVEEEEMEAVTTSEQEFVFKEFSIKFAKPDVLKAYVLLLADFQTNSTHTNHCCVKMLHRVSVDLHCVGMMFQISLFRVFQKILLSPLAKASRYKEVSKFATFVVRRFVEVAQNNPKVFMEMLFWKSSKEAIEIVDGYGTYQSKAKVMWSEDLEMELRRLYDDYKDNEEDGKDTVDCIMERLTDPSKTRIQIIRELKRQELIGSAKELKKSKGGSRAGPWREEEELELQELFRRYRESDDPVGNIMADMTAKRSKGKVIDKILTLGLVLDRKDLYKKRRGKSGRSRRRGGSEDRDRGSDNDLQELPSDYEDPDLPGSSDSEDGGAGKGSSDSAASDLDNPEGQGEAPEGGISAVIENVVKKGYKGQIKWIQRALRRVAEDKEDEDDSVGVPIVPLSEENETAMEDNLFLSFLRQIGLSAPANEQEAFWRIPGDLTIVELKNIADGLELNEDDKPLNADKIVVKQRPKQKRKKKSEKKKEKKKEEKKKEVKKKRNASKFDALKELAKRKKERTEKKKRSKRQPLAGSDSEDEMRKTREESELATENHQPVKTTPPSKKKKRRIQKFVESDSDDSRSKRQPLAGSDSEDGDEMRETREESEPVTENHQPVKTTPPSKKKKRRIQKFVESDSDDSDNDRLVISGFGGKEMENQSQETGNEPPSMESQPLVFHSDSDSDTPLNTVTSTNLKTRKENMASSDEDIGNQSGKRSRSPVSMGDSDTEKQPKKRSRLLDSDSDDDEDVPLVASLSKTNGKRSVASDDSDEDLPLSLTKSQERPTGESFPATLLTQGDESDSELEDHIPLRRAIQKKPVIESDKED